MAKEGLWARVAARRRTVQAGSFRTGARPPVDRSAPEERLSAGSLRAGRYRLARLDLAALVQVGRQAGLADRRPVGRWQVVSARADSWLVVEPAAFPLEAS